MTNIVDGTERFLNDIRQMLTEGSENDVTIILKDGEILANKDVLSARSEYFSTMFRINSGASFVEGITKSVTMTHCTKVIMDKIITYLFSGKTSLQDLTLLQLIQLMNLAAMMMLNELKEGVENFALGFIPDSGTNCAMLPELVKGLMSAEQFKLWTVKKALALELYRSLRDIPNIPDVVLDHDAFKNLPFDVLEDILVQVEWSVESSDDFSFATSMEKIDIFMYWLSSNNCSAIEKKRIANSVDLDEFTAEELLTVVRKSNLFSVQLIDRKVLKIIKNQMASINKKEIEIREKDALIQQNNCQLLENSRQLALHTNSLKIREDKIVKKRMEIAHLKLENKKLKTYHESINVSTKSKSGQEN